MSGGLERGPGEERDRASGGEAVRSCRIALGGLNSCWFAI